MSSNKKLLQGASGYINQSSSGGDSSEAFSTWVYNGNGQTSEYYTKHQNGINFADDGGMVWIKSNDTNYKAVMVDTVRGANSILYSDDTGAEFSNSSIVTQFYNNGFRIGNQNIVGQNGYHYTSWSFKKQAKFFDIQTWNGNGTAGRQISHNLGCEPGMIWVKNRTGAGNSWYIYHRKMGTSYNSNQYYALLNDNMIPQASSTSPWNNTSPTSTHFTVSSSGSVNASGYSYIAYIFAHDDSDDSIIKCGRFTTDSNKNSSTTSGINPEELGFVPCWLWLKSATSSYHHVVVDEENGWSSLPAQYNNYRYLTPGQQSSQGYPETGLYRTHNGFATNRGAYNYNNMGYPINANTTYMYMAIKKPMFDASNGDQVYGTRRFNGNGGNYRHSVGWPVDMVMHYKRSSGDYNMLFSRMICGYANYGTGTTQQRNQQCALLFNENWSSVRPGNFSRTVFPNFDKDNPVGNTYPAETNQTMNQFIYQDADSAWNQTNIPYQSHFFRRGKGFLDQVYYRGNNTIQTLKHSLGSTPAMIWIKDLDNYQNWTVWHKDLSVATSRYLELNTNNSEQTASHFPIAPTADEFSINNAQVTGGSNSNYLAILWGEKAGVSKAGIVSPPGNNGSVTLDLGFSTGTKFFMIKRIDANGDWYMFYTDNHIAVGNDGYYKANSNAAEVEEFNSTDLVDPINQGIIINDAGFDLFGSDSTSAKYVYYAIGKG